jgi:hypothetical protein
MQNCVTLTSQSPHYVMPYDIYVTPYDCIEPCDAVAELFYFNNSDIPRSFIPGIIVDSALTTFSTVALASGGQFYLAVDIKGLTAGQHTMQPFPNGESFAEYVMVYPKP